MVDGGTTTVTVVVTDLVDSTRLLQLGAGAFDDVRRSSLEAMAAGVTACRGTVVKSTGDGVLAVFTSAADAVAAAVAVQRSANALRRRDGRCPEVRVGVASGEATSEQGDWFGSPVIEAARLCALAQGGQVLATAVVRALVGPHRGHRWRSLESVVLKGFDDAVEVVEVGWEPAAPEAPPLPPAADRARTAEIVGRGDELDRLVTAWKSSLAGEGRAVLVSGEPGIGKTRLVAELTARARDDGATVLWGHCDEDVGSGYRPFTEALRPWFATGQHRTDGLDRSALARLLPEVGDEVAPGLSVAGGDGEGERLRLFDAVVALLHRAAEDGPLLLVLDDVHWATTPTLLLLRHVVLHPQPLPLLVVATYRDTELDRTHPLSGVLADLRRASQVERVLLGGLTPTGVLELVEAAAGGEVDATAEELATAIHAETEGNPFFVGQVLRHLVETGVVVRDGPTWRLTRPLDDVGIPEGVREVVGWRLSRLSPAANDVLAIAAVAGREFDLAVLRAATDLGQEGLIVAVDEAVAAHLVVELDGGGRFAFVHALVRQTLLSELTRARRSLVHRRIGERLAQRPGADPAVVAYHLCEGAVAGSVEEAVRWSVLAMDAAWSQVAFEEGIAVGRRVVEILDLVDDDAHRARADVLSRLSRLVQYVGDTTEAKALGDAAVEAGRASGDPVLFGEAVAARYMWARAGVAEPGAAATLAEAVDAVGDRAPSTRALLLAVAALHRAVNDNVGAAALPEALAAAAAARVADDQFILQLALFVQASVVLGTPDVDTQLSALAEMEGLVLDPTVWAIGPVTSFDRARIRFVASLQRGDRAGAERAIDEALETTYSAGAGRMPAAMSSMWRACLALADGRLAAARTEADGLLALSSLDPNFQNSWASLTFRVAWEEGSAGSLVDLVRGVAAATPGLVALRVVLAQALLAAGDDDAARTILRELTADGVAAVPRDVVWSATLAQLTELAAALDDVDAATALRPLLEPFAGQLVVVAWGVFVAGAADRYLGMVDLVAGDPAAAVAALDTAVEQEASLGMTGLALRSRWWRARALAAAGRGGEAQVEAAAVVEAAAALGIGSLTVPPVDPQAPQPPLPSR